MLIYTRNSLSRHSPSSQLKFNKFPPPPSFQKRRSNDQLLPRGNPCANTELESLVPTTRQIEKKEFESFQGRIQFGDVMALIWEASIPLKVVGVLQTVRVWQGSEDGEYNCRHILKDHTAKVQAVTVHASNNYFVTASLDNTWCFYDISTGPCLTQIADPSETEGGYTCTSLHLDGGACWGSNCHIFLREWLLLAILEFDHSGSYLALGVSDMRVYQAVSVKKEWNIIKTFPDLSGTSFLSLSLSQHELAVTQLKLK